MTFSFFHFDIDFKHILSLHYIIKRHLKSRVATANFPFLVFFSAHTSTKHFHPPKPCRASATVIQPPSEKQNQNKTLKSFFNHFPRKPRGEGGDQPFKSLHLSTELRSVRLLSRYLRSPIVCKSLRQLSEKENIMKSSPAPVDMIPT